MYSRHISVVLLTVHMTATLRAGETFPAFLFKVGTQTTSGPFFPQLKITI